MPLDAICLSALKDELSGQITGAKIDKVQQPERDVIILAMRGVSGSHKLLISAGSNDARVHLTGHQFENPSSPPMFCMLLRKHLVSARIQRIAQPLVERILEIELQSPDAMGVFSEKRLILEFIGRSSNIILTDSDGIIIDCLRRLGGEENKRMVLPGLKYRRPPEQEGKINPFELTPDVWRTLFNSADDVPADNWLLTQFSALSPLICRELSFRAYGEIDFRLNLAQDEGEALRREFFALIEQSKAGRFEPCVISDQDNTPKDFSFTRITQYEGALSVIGEPGFSAMLDSFYTRKAQTARVKQRASSTVKTIKNARDRLSRKLAMQHEELKKTADRDSFRECGDILTANFHLMEKGVSILKALDFYAEDADTVREISIDPLKTPQQNAAKYYKAYTKAKTAEKYLTEQIAAGERELEYLESVLEEISLAEGERDLDEIRGELIETGYLKAQKQGKRKMSESKPMLFESSTGVQILAGRNNMQNDKLTLKAAVKTDTWLHTQKIHGSHVIIAGVEPDETTLYEAAVIAAYYSSARQGGKVPVDYTQVRHVKKPPGGRPGMVIYTEFRTIIATPDEELVRRLRKG
ncbi:MAG: NFACT family protein [Oscillospiraceae bacterium]|nr:NFACT family protein [Oscillospiraceae bacterium]